eukprot:Amastigsp_a841994_25.p1 type:complete len:169 gc:universal Amastigsp_a841994_25:551-45(-)
MSWMWASLGGRRDRDEERGDGFLDELHESLTLSTTTRFYGFLMFFLLGMILSVLSTSFLASMRLSKFAVTYSLGNLISLASSSFLIGPAKQMRNMFQPARALASVVYIGSTGLTLYAALVLRNRPLTILLVFVQFCALVWYCASYIPFARRCIKATITGVFNSVRRAA